MGIMEDSDEEIRKYGLRIYTIIKNGPLDKGGAKELSDFIIPSEEVMSRQMDFDEWLKTHANKEVNISLYSLLTKKIREIKITTNPIGSKDGILGASVKKENWTIANKNVLHITSVEENSFAQKELGLVPFEDYIVGVRTKTPPIISLNQENVSPLDILGDAIRKNKGKLMKFYIYNKVKGARDVTVTIGNDYYFSLGCEGAFGALHMFPSIDDNDNKIEENNTNGGLIKEKNVEKENNNITKDNNANISENNNTITIEEQDHNTTENINKIVEEITLEKDLDDENKKEEEKGENKTETSIFD